MTIKVGDKLRCIKITKRAYNTDPTIGQEYEYIGEWSIGSGWGDFICPIHGSIQFLLSDFEPVLSSEHFHKPPPETSDRYVPIHKPVVYTCPYEEYNDKYNLEEP